MRASLPLREWDTKGLGCRVVLCVAGAIDTTGEVVGVWGPVVTGGTGVDTGTESDPRAPVGGADINHCLEREKKVN